MTVTGTVRLEWIFKVKFRRTGFVIAEKHYPRSDHSCNRTLIFVRQSIQQPRRQGHQNHVLTRVRLIVAHLVVQRAPPGESMLVRKRALASATALRVRDSAHTIGGAGGA